MEIKESLKTHFFIGTGGVGKTTLASLFALRLAQENKDSKIKLITIDPSNRLKTFFGMSGQESEAKFSNLSVQLDDRSKLLRDFVTQSALKQNIDPDEVFKNKLFSTLMDGLAVSQEFSSLYELTVNHDSQDFDFVVIDTPPLQNTSDFLNSAEVLTEFFSSSLAKFFLSQDERGLMYKIVNSARRTSLKVLGNLTGSDFVEELSFFFKVVEFLREDLLEVLKNSQEILETKANVHIVCNANELSLCGVKVALENLTDTKLNLQNCILNKFDPNSVGENVQRRIKKLKANFKDLDYIQVGKFKTEPNSYKDLLQEVGDVRF